MKTRKVFLAIFAMSIIALLSACSVENAPNAANISERNEPHITIGGVSVYADTDGDFRSAIVNEIHATRSMNTRELQANGNHSANRIAEITEFYFPPAEIVGFELRRVIMSESSFGFSYIPEEESNVSAAEYTEEIRVVIRRGEWYKEQNIDIFLTWVEQAQNESWGRLTECGNMLYSEKHSLIVARMQDTTIRIDVPPELNTFEFLRDLALQVIETAELITV
jgi:hypothetical protein